MTKTPTSLRLLAKQCVALSLALSLIAALPAMAAPPPLGHLMTPVEPATSAANFSLPDIDGDPHALQDYRGKVIMLNFWASWCPPCRREMPSMERLYQKFSEQGLVVIAVNQWEDPDLVFEFTGRLSLEPTFPILLDRESKVSEQYGVKGLPTTFLIDRDGKLRYRAMGGRDFDHPEVESLIESLL